MASITMSEALGAKGKKGFKDGKNEKLVSTHNLVEQKTFDELEVERRAKKATEDPKALGLGREKSGQGQPSAIKLKVHEEEK